MITIKSLFKNYSLGKEKFAVLQDINLQIKQGEFICILGTSGCGKSTLLNVIGGLDNDVEGDLIFEEKNTQEFHEKDWVRFRKQYVGFVFQNFNLIPHLNARENIELAMKFNGCKAKDRRKKAEHLLELVGLSERSSYLPSQLSGGQKQRVAIARALANDPNLILADEPTGALDSQSAKEVMELLYEIHRKYGVTVVLVTHNKELAKEADRVIYMADGHIEKTTSREEEKDDIVSHNVTEKILRGKVQKTGKMSLLSSCQVGIKNVLLKKSRSIFTVLGTSIGIAGMVLMMGIGIGADDKIHYELRSFVGDDTIWVTHMDKKETFSQREIEKICSIEGVDSVLDNQMFYSTYYYNDASAEGVMDALGPKKQETSYEKEMADLGGMPKADDSREIVLTSQVAEALLGNQGEKKDLIGKKIKILTRLAMSSTLTYEVEQELVVTGIRDTGIIAGSSFVPYDTAQDLAEKSAKTEQVPKEGVKVMASEHAVYDEVVEAIKALDYRTETNKEDFASINALIMALKVFLIFVAGIALLVSGIMIKIVLHTNVVERTKEIGIMCAIGAGKKEIKRIFVTEAGILGSLSGIMGILLGQILGSILNVVICNKFSVMNFKLYKMTPQAVLFCFVVSMVITVFAGTKPAKKAAKIIPSETLRYE
ncbi:MAG: ATP-binding cassette domain-containing protein [Lachnospiraceae bacterium]|nr:ATP-binding cassette domain-containing protein [Lachnospiraceae bacterium]